MADLSVVESVIRVGVALVSFFLLAAVALAYRRRPSRRMGLVLLAFTIFGIEGIILLYEVFIADTSFTESAYYVFQFVELLVLAAAVLKR